MDVRTGIRNVLVALVTVGVVVLLIVLLFRVIFGHSGAPQQPQTDVGKYSATNATATLLMDGPTNLNQLHYQVKISVNANQSEIDVIQGYQGNVVKSQTYPSNSSAFGAFLQSLKLQGFAKGKNVNSDYRGYCPAGTRYLYSFNDGQADLFTYWSTSCGGQGTFEGNPAGVRQLFEQQIPPTDLANFTSDTGVTL